ncbi:MAG: preprotein translocase subunit SecE [Chloroflexi bacterium]|nr:preprotein translocase subunit SecE [Chloroflexota bacterium]
MVREAQRENRISQYVRETRAELRKVVWPTREEAINLTAIVVGTIFVMSIFFGTVDYLLTQLFRLLISR